jgi:23S rRNA-/tRNA-specific pseudouridylate synthase
MASGPDVEVPRDLEPRIPPTARGHRLDRAVHGVARDAGLSVSRVEVRRALGAGVIRIDGRAAAPGARAAGGEQVDLRSFRPKSAWRLAPRLDLMPNNPVVAETASWVALAKAPGLPTLPLRDPEAPSLLHVAIAFDPSIETAGPPGEGGAVHRLDNETSGVVLFARDEATRVRLRRAFAHHQVEKIYEALVRDHGPDELPPPRIRGQIQTTGGARVRVRPAAAGAAGPESRVELIDRADGVARLRVRSRWGRRHQVRAHLATAGWPILGDRLYAPAEDAAALPRLGLHACALELDGVIVRVDSGWEGRAQWPRL